MKRNKLKAYYKVKVEEFKQKGYIFWKRAFSMTRKDYMSAEDSIEGKPVYLELVLLEDKEEYLHISVSVFDDGWWNSVFTVSGSFIVRNGEQTNKIRPKCRQDECLKMEGLAP